MVLAASAAPGWADSARYRSVDPELPAVQGDAPQSLRFAAEQDYAPWSFKGADGKLMGLAVEVAAAACVQAKLSCSIVELPNDQLLPALGRGEVEAVITGLHLTPSVLALYDSTRPWYRSTASFFMTSGTDLELTDPRSLAGRRIGVIKGSEHEAFLNRAYSRSAIISEVDATALMGAVKSGAVDVGFADTLPVKAWLASGDAAGCCVLLGAAFVDPSTFSRPLAMLVKRNSDVVRSLLDDALDALDQRGDTAKIFERYIP